MKHSIRVKMIVTLIILLLSSIFVCWFLNKQYLAEYYKDKKVTFLETMYSEVESALEEFVEAEDSDDADTAFEVLNSKLNVLSGNNNVSLNIFSAYVTYTVSKFGETQPTVFIKGLYPRLITKDQTELLQSSVGKYFEDSNKSKSHYLVKNDDYTIMKVFDTRTQSNYIELFGELSDVQDGYYIYVNSNFEGINESVEIANQFLGYVGILVILIASIIMFFVTRSFTEPIYQLSNIARNMSNLDFTVKYKNARKDEIGVLGNSINVLSEQLEHTISELKSANNELQKDIANKVQIDEMRKEFLSNVTHELKTPIALIQGYAEGLKENISDDQESREFYCEVIIDEAAKMNTMVKKLLTLNQLESGNDMVTFEHFDIVLVIKSVINSVDILLQQKNVKVIFDDSSEVLVWADEYMIEEVIMNYISNAINHVKEPNVIEIKLIFHDGLVRVAVFNTGDSIPEEDLPNIWTKFYKVDKARTREYGGNGIGLSIVKAIMNSHNQCFGVRNRETGVEFWFELDVENRM